MTFADLELIDPLIRAVAAEGYTTPTPIQAQAIPHVLKGRDLLGIAQTGTGKTAAFALPILQRLAAAPPPKGGRPIRVLVLSPTRELCSQIGDSFATYGKHTGLRHAVIFGGVGQEPQVRTLRHGIDILVAAPGRLLDLMQQGYVHLQNLEVFVLDEADRMLDMGFIHDVKRVIAALPRRRQTLLFSATMPPDVQAIADAILIDPMRVEVTPVASTAEKVEQWLYFVEKADKRKLLLHLLEDPVLNMERTLVFTRTKHGANRVAEALEKARVGAAAIHGNKSQGARERALEGFKRGTVRVLVATDIAARGIDVEGITHVINFDLPNVPEQYVHRIGRTARAGASGMALSFCEEEEREYLRDIERLIRNHVPVVAEHPFQSPLAPPTPTNLHGTRRAEGVLDGGHGAQGGRRGRGGAGGGHGQRAGHAPQGHSRPHPRPATPNQGRAGHGASVAATPGGSHGGGGRGGGGGGGAPARTGRRRRRRGRGGGATGGGGSGSGGRGGRSGSPA
jgi:ATP-dependent RNA helicase RhlE